MTQYSRLTLAAAVAATMAGTSTSTLAQSSDALIDKLVDKGILTVNEAKDLRDEADKDFATAHSTKTGMPEWVTALKVNGDFRGRYESFSFDDPASVARNRFRYRARLGFTANIKDQFEVGLRLTSSEAASGASGGDPISGNTTFSDNASKKNVYLDLAYAKWSPINTADWTGVFTLGKMENPFLFPSTMMFDRDYTPEGAAGELTWRPADGHSLKMTGGGFVLDERGGNSDNPYLASAQMRWDAKWNKHLASSIGVSAWMVGNSGGTNLASVQVPNQNSGNTRVGTQLVNDYTPVQADVSLTYTMDSFPMYPAAFPITAFGEYIKNTAVSDQDQGYAAGVMFGKSGKKGAWDLSYQYRRFEGDASYEEFAESDFGANYINASSPLSGGGTGYRAGTNVKGHILRAQYSPYDSFTFGISYWLTELIVPSPSGSESGTGRLQVDAVLKF